MPKLNKQMQPILNADSFRHISEQLKIRFVNAGLSNAVKTADLICIRIIYGGKLNENY